MIHFHKWDAGTMIEEDPYDWCQYWRYRCTKCQKSKIKVVFLW